jgi:hypothetical protein
VRALVGLSEEAFATPSTEAVRRRARGKLTDQEAIAFACALAGQTR